MKICTFRQEFCTFASNWQESQVDRFGWLQLVEAEGDGKTAPECIQLRGRFNVALTYLVW
jgi:hypothetical protein